MTAKTATAHIEFFRRFSLFSSVIGRSHMGSAPFYKLRGFLSSLSSRAWCFFSAGWLITVSYFDERDGFWTRRPSARNWVIGVV